MSGTPLLDWAIIDDLRDHIGDDAMRAVFELFATDSRDLVDAIVGASARGGDPASRDAARRGAHALKSSAGQVGAAALAEAALAVEAAAERGDPDLGARIEMLTATAAATAAAFAEWLK